MLENAIKKADSGINCKEKIKEMRESLSSIQLELRDRKMPVILIFEGWEASGKGSIIADIIRFLDPRFFKVYSTVQPGKEEKRYPFLKRFWMNIPEYGKISVMDRSWYQDLSIPYSDGKISKNEYNERILAVRNFEQQLSDDGYLIIKFFLHISKNEQKKRFEKLRDDSETKWRVTEKDKKQNKNYERYYEAFDEMLFSTSFSFAPWNIINTKDKTASRYHIFRIINETVRNALDGKRSYQSVHSNFPVLSAAKLSDVILSGKTVSPVYYPELLKQSQNELSRLHNLLYQSEKTLILCFEGWDAAGKGGAIKRISSALDPRGFEAVPVSAPDSAEISRHYLWRFWKHIPKSGHITIFDRTWYGRVMVEKIEGFTDLSRCNAAYDEINEFEYELSRNGAIILKFWLQIDQDEQLNRFTLRQNTPEKQWKITDEDWRNREKWNQYETAVDEMISRTSTSFAPWNIIEANDKLYARIKILSIINRAVEKNLGII